MASASRSLQMDSHSLSYEESILRDPYSLSHWLTYLDYKSSGAAVPSQEELAQRWTIYERALRVMPGSYKLWSKYTKERVAQTRSLPPNSPVFDEVNNLFERCLVAQSKMPVLWREYLAFLTPQFKLTRIRRTFDRALASLAVTQHDKFVWPSYLAWAISCGVAETGVRVYKRYLQVQPQAREDYIRFLKKSGRLEEAAVELTKLVNDDKFVSQRGRSRHELWTELLQLLVRNPKKMSASSTINVDAIIRSGIERFAADQGSLWTSLADYYIRLGLFEKARDVYEESVGAVATVRDFGLVFDAYAKFEESLLSAKMAEVESGAAEANDDEAEAAAAEPAGHPDDELVLAWYESEGNLSSSKHPELMDLEIDLSMARLDHLLARRPLLLSSVVLRQNPHHVGEWMNRVSLFPTDPVRQVSVYSEAVSTIDPFKANGGKLERLWVAFARFYETHGDLPNARLVFAKGAKVNFKHVDALAGVWTEWVEMELRHGQYDAALATVKKALTIPAGLSRQNLGWGSKEKGEESRALTSQQRLYKSTKLWSLYADLEENFGSLESCKGVYDQMFFLKIVTPALVLSYAALMWEHKFFEDTFRIYEKATQLFAYPHVYPIWMVYLHQFMERYGGGTGAARKIERVRDLFEQAIKGLPKGATETKKIFLLYAKYEEDQGLARRSMEIYARACESAPPADRYELYIVYLARCAHRFGLARTREIYEAAIRNLPDAHVKAMSLRYARLERALGEIDRARAIYSYASQFCDPRVEQGFWATWSQFEVSHGNQDTFKEHLRVKRSVLAHHASTSIVAQASSAVPTVPANSIRNASRAPGSKEREEKAAARQQARADDEKIAGSKRRREEEEEQHAAEQAEEEQKSMGAGARFAAAREQREREANGEEAPDAAAAADGEINLEDEEIQLDEEEEAPLAEAAIAVKSVPDAVFGLGAANTTKAK